MSSIRGGSVVCDRSAPDYKRGQQYNNYLGSLGSSPAQVDLGSADVVTNLSKITGREPDTRFAVQRCRSDAPVFPHKRSGFLAMRLAIRRHLVYQCGHLTFCHLSGVFGDLSLGVNGSEYPSHSDFPAGWRNGSP